MRELTFYPEFEKLKGFHDAFKLADMDKAVERYAKQSHAVKKSVSMAIMTLMALQRLRYYLTHSREMDVSVDYYIPNRFKEGYGLTEGGE